jgi:hypothetical protein
MWNLLLWTFAASAADLASEETWALDAPANDVEAVTRDGVPYVVVATRSEIVVLDAAGSEVSSLPRGAEDAAAYDADGDGAPDLAICAADGLWLVPWTGSGLADPIQVDTAPCEALVAHDLDGNSGVAAADGSSLALWWADGAGGLGARELAEADLDGDPRLAVAPGKLAAASLGGSIVWDRDSGATEAGGIVADVGADASGWLVALWDARTVGPLGGTGADVGARPRAIAVGDVDGDGADDVIAVTDSGTLAWPGHPEVDLGEDGAAVAVGDLDGDGCGEVLVALDLTPEIVVAGVGTCGFCEMEVTVEGPETLTEGSSGLWTASVDACGQDVVWTWEVDSLSGASCVPDGAEVTCAFPDDDIALLLATATTATGERNGNAYVTVDNAPPSIVPSAGVDVSGGIVTVDVPCGGTVQLELADPGPSDSVFVTPLAEGNFRMDSFGAIEGPPFDDVGFFVADVQDDDGAVTTYDVEVSTFCGGDDTGWTDTGWGDGGDVVEPNCCGACCWLAVLVLFGGIRPVRVAALAAVGL